MSRPTAFGTASSTATQYTIPCSQSAPIAIVQVTTSPGTFPTSKTLVHPVTAITVQNLHGQNKMVFRTDGITAGLIGAGNVNVGPGEIVTVPCGATSGSVTLDVQSNIVVDEPTPWAARLH